MENTNNNISLNLNQTTNVKIITDDEKEILNQLNKFREDPASFEKNFSVTSKVFSRIHSKKKIGAELFKLSKTLKNKPKLNSFIVSKGLCASADCILKDNLKDNYVFEHKDSKELEEIVKIHTKSFNNLFQIIDEGDYEQLISRCMVSQYDPQRTYRDALSNENYKYIGFATLKVEDECKNIILLSESIEELETLDDNHNHNIDEDTNNIIINSNTENNITNDNKDNENNENYEDSPVPINLDKTENNNTYDNNNTSNNVEIAQSKETDIVEDKLNISNKEEADIIKNINSEDNKVNDENKNNNNNIEITELEKKEIIDNIFVNKSPIKQNENNFNNINTIIDDERLKKHDDIINVNVNNNINELEQDSNKLEKIINEKEKEEITVNNPNLMNDNTIKFNQTIEEAIENKTGGNTINDDDNNINISIENKDLVTSEIIEDAKINKNSNQVENEQNSKMNNDNKELYDNNIKNIEINSYGLDDTKKVVITESSTLNIPETVDKILRNSVKKIYNLKKESIIQEINTKMKEHKRNTTMNITYQNNNNFNSLNEGNNIITNNESDKTTDVLNKEININNNKSNVYNSNELVNDNKDIIPDKSKIIIEKNDKLISEAKNLNQTNFEEKEKLLVEISDNIDKQDTINKEHVIIKDVIKKSNDDNNDEENKLEQPIKKNDYSIYISISIMSLACVGIYFLKNKFLK